MDVDFSFLSVAENVNVSCDLLIQVIHEACSVCIPTVSIPANPLPVWFTSEIRHALNKARTLRRLVNKMPSQARTSKLSALESGIGSLIQSAKESYISSLVTQFASDPKKLFRT